MFMKIVKNLILQVALLVVLCFAGTICIKLYDMFLNLNIKSIGKTGFTVGFVNWLFWLVFIILKKSFGGSENKK